MSQKECIEEIDTASHTPECLNCENALISPTPCSGSMTTATELNESEQETTSGMEDEDDDDDEDAMLDSSATGGSATAQNTEEHSEENAVEDSQDEHSHSTENAAPADSVAPFSNDTAAQLHVQSKPLQSTSSTKSKPNESSAPRPIPRASVRAPQVKFINPYTQLSDEEGLLVAHVTQFIHNRHNREIDRKRLQRKLERLEYHLIMDEVYNYLNDNRQCIARDFTNKFPNSDNWRRKSMLTMTDYALQDFIFSETISSMCMASIRTKISFLEDFNLIEQCVALRQQPISFFEIAPVMAQNANITFPKAIEELNRIETYKTPAQMLRCILNTVNIIFEELLEACGDQHVSADELLPILIYTIVNASELQNPLMIVEYVQSLAHQEGEAAYYLVLFESALHAVKRDLLLPKMHTEEQGHQEDESDWMYVEEDLSCTPLPKDLEHESNPFDEANAGTSKAPPQQQS